MALHRDRTALPATAAVIVAMVAITAASITKGYPTAASRQELAATLGASPAFLALLGPLQATGVAAVSSWRVGLFMIAAVGVVVAMSVVRHTRKEEEAGRTELVRAGATGALAPLLAAGKVGVITAAASAVPIMLVTARLADGRPGAWWVGAQYFGVGVAAAGLAMLVAQLATTSRTATAMAAATVMVGYALRGVADVRQDLGWLHWVSPIGWAQKVDPFGTPSLWPFVLCLALGVALAVVAGVVALHRDLGAGLIQPRPGPARAAGLRSPWALQVRVHGSTVPTWAVAAGSYGLIVGLILPSIASLLTSSPRLEKALTALGGASGLENVMTATVVGFAGMAAGAWAITVTMALVHDESLGRLGLVLSTPVSRGRFAGAAAGLLVIGVVAIPVVFALMLAGGHLMAGGPMPTSLTDPLGGALVQIPPSLVVAGLALALYGWAPRAVVAAWVLVVWGFIMDIAAVLLGLPSWVAKISPYALVPRVPGETVSAGTLVALVAVAVALAVVGALGLRRRDLING